LKNSPEKLVSILTQLNSSDLYVVLSKQLDPNDLKKVLEIEINETKKHNDIKKHDERHLNLVVYQKYIS
jgi:hypothetical protein